MLLFQADLSLSFVVFSRFFLALGRRRWRRRSGRGGRGVQSFCVTFLTKDSAFPYNIKKNYRNFLHSYQFLPSLPLFFSPFILLSLLLPCPPPFLLHQYLLLTAPLWEGYIATNSGVQMTRELGNDSANLPLPISHFPTQPHNHTPHTPHLTSPTHFTIPHNTLLFLPPSPPTQIHLYASLLLQPTLLYPTPPSYPKIHSPPPLSCATSLGSQRGQFP